MCWDVSSAVIPAEIIDLIIHLFLLLLYDCYLQERKSCKFAIKEEKMWKKKQTPITRLRWKSANKHVLQELVQQVKGY